MGPGMVQGVGVGASWQLKVETLLSYQYKGSVLGLQVY